MLAFSFLFGQPLNVKITNQLTSGFLPIASLSSILLLAGGGLGGAIYSYDRLSLRDRFVERFIIALRNLASSSLDFGCFYSKALFFSDGVYNYGLSCGDLSSDFSLDCRFSLKIS